MSNNKSLFIILAVLGLFIAGLILRQANLLLLALPFLTYLIMGLFRSPSEIHLQAVRTPSRSIANAQEPVKMNVIVRNSGATNLYVRLEDSLHPSIKLVDGQVDRYVYLTPDEQADLSYTFQADRGVYAWKAIHATATDPFSLFEKTQEFPASTEVVIRPGSTWLQHIPLRPFITRHIPGSMPARLPGSGMSFFGTREYQPGDAFRKIHWRMTARHPGELFTKEFEQDEIADIGLILDARAIEGDKTGESSLFEKSVSASASLADLFLREGNRVGLLVFGEKMTALYPSSGKKHSHRIQRTLAQASAGRAISLNFLSYFSVRLFPRQSIIFIISCLNPRDLSVYSRLASDGYQLILLSPNPIEQLRGSMSSDPVHSLAYRAATLERFTYLRQLVNLGMQVINWTVDCSVDEVLQRALSFSPMGHLRRIRG